MTEFRIVLAKQNALGELLLYCQRLDGYTNYVHRVTVQCLDLEIDINFQAIVCFIVKQYFQEGVNTDVVVTGEDPNAIFHAHKCILANASEFLR